MDNEK
jgi:serine/threonine protein kinase